MNTKKITICIFLIICLAAAVYAAGRVLPRNPKEAEMTTKDFSLYPRSKGAWVGDVMPMGTDDALNLYYLYDTDHNGSGYHPIHRFSTDNFYNYNDDGCMLLFGDKSESPDRAIGTGSVLIAKDGKWHCFYTGHNDGAPARGEDKECVMHAVSDDGKNWTKIPSDTFYAEDNYSGDDFRDPFVFYNEEDGCYWLLIAARRDDLGGVVARYVSDDLKAWTICEPLYAPKKQFMTECPDLFKMGDKYYLFYSWDCVTYYAESDSIYGPFTAPKDNVLDGTGFCFYAAKTAEFKGKRYLCGWVGRKNEKKDTGNYGWAGNMVIHELVLRPDGSLGVKAPESIDELLSRQVKPNIVKGKGIVNDTKNGYTLISKKDDISILSLGRREDVMSLEFDVTIEGEGYAGLGYGSGDNYDKYTGMVLDSKNNSIHFEGCVLSRLPYVTPFIHTYFDFSKSNTHHVKIVMENEIVVTYVDDTKALTTRVYKSEEDKDLVLYACNATCTYENITIKTVK